MSQQVTSVPLNDLVTIDLPKGTIKLSKEEFRATLKKNDSNLKLHQIKGEFYKINNMMIEFIGAHGIAPENYLENIKKGLDDGFGLGVSKSYFSLIKSINNYKVLIIHEDQDSLTKYSFFTINNTGKSALNGITSFNITDKKKNIAMIDKILKSINFK